MKTKPFDIAEHLETDEDIHGFLEAVLAEGTADDYLHALNIAARAKGMTEIARQAGVSRGSLYKSLAADGNPRFGTIVKVTKALGCRLAVTASRP